MPLNNASNFTNELSARDGFARPPVVAVLIPCYNEESTIAKVIADFKRELPEAQLDNNSTDDSADFAKQAGAAAASEQGR